MKWWILVAVLAMGCQDKSDGLSTLYIYNGTKQRRSVKVVGDEMRAEFLLRQGTGKLFEEQEPGERTVAFRSGDGSARSTKLELERDAFTIVNIDAAACFARADVSGMYVPGKTPVKVNEIYDREPLISMESAVHVFPGERLPEAKPQSPFGFNRVAVVPCESVEDRYALADHIKELR